MHFAWQITLRLESIGGGGYFPFPYPIPATSPSPNIVGLKLLIVIKWVQFSQFFLKRWYSIMRMSKNGNVVVDRGQIGQPAHLSVLEVEESSQQLELETSETSQNETWHTFAKIYSLPKLEANYINLNANSLNMKDNIYRFFGINCWRDTKYLHTSWNFKFCNTFSWKTQRPTCCGRPGWSTNTPSSVRGSHTREWGHISGSSFLPSTRELHFLSRQTFPDCIQSFFAQSMSESRVL